MDTQTGGFTPSYQPTQDRPRKKSKLLFFFVIFLVILGALYFIGRGKLSRFSQKLESSKVSATPTPTPFPTDTPEPTQQPSGTPSATPTKTQTVQSPIDKKTGLDRSKLTVEVDNGSGVVGAASKISDLLKSLGYHVTAIGNADNFDYETTVINVKSDKQQYLPLVKSDLSSSYTIGSTSATLTASSSADAQVIVGKE